MAPVTRRSFEVIDGGPDHDITDYTGDNSATAKALAQMKQAEPSFVVTDFLKGARSAYEMILTAFDAGEVDRDPRFPVAQMLPMPSTPPPSPSARRRG